jgi:hypothetical protein
MEKKIPHMAIITVRGVVNRQLPDGRWHPSATFNDGFTVQFEGKSEQEVISLLKDALKRMEESCQQITTE